MKYLFLFLISFPVFACKGTPEGYENQVLTYMKEVLKKDNLVIKKNSWADDLYVVMAVGNSRCRIRSYKVSQDVSCKLSANLITDRTCL